MSVPVRIGSVPYLNSVPLTDGIEERCLFLPPSALAARLDDGAIDGQSVGRRDGCDEGSLSG